MIFYNFIVARLRSAIFTLFNKIENNNNADFFANGEAYFLDGLFNKINSPAVLFDIGGNIGGYSEILVRLAKSRSLDYSLHVFEPTASCFEVLGTKLSGNNSVILNNVGVSNSAGTTDIFYDTQQSGFASLYHRNLASINVDLKMKEEITLIRLEDYIESTKIPKIDFLKIDIEGHELKAFEGMGKYLNGDFIKVIQFEYGGANLDSRTNLLDLFTLFEERGFVVGKIMRHGVEIRTYQSWMDNFQYANYLAISKQFRYLVGA